MRIPKECIAIYAAISQGSEEIQNGLLRPGVATVILVFFVLDGLLSDNE